MSDIEHIIDEKLDQAEKRQLESAAKQDHQKDVSNNRFVAGGTLAGVVCVLLGWLVYFSCDHTQVKDNIKSLTANDMETRASLKLHDAAIAELKQATSITNLQLGSLKSSSEEQGRDIKTLLTRSVVKRHDDQDDTKGKP